MDPAERLADYLADELDPDERAALEAELARDPALRARLAAIEDADAALDQLSSPIPPEGFDERLDSHLDAVLTQELGPGAAVDQDPAHDTADTSGADAHGANAPDGNAPDELERRRQRRAGTPRWVTAVSGAAAAIVVIAGGGVVLSNIGMFGGQADSDLADSDQPADSTMSTMDAIEERAESADGSLEGPLLASRDREFDDADVESLLADADVFALADQALMAEAAGSLSAPYRAAFDTAPGRVFGEPELDAPDAGDGAVPPDADADDGDEAEAAGPPAGLRVEGEVSADDAAAVSRCLDVLLAEEVTAVVVYAELAVYDGDEVVVFGLVSESPATATFSRREAWVLERDTCSVRLFTQS